MRVTRDGCVAFDLVFEFAGAAAESVVELLLLAELRGLSGERRLNPGEFFGEADDERLLRACEARLGVGAPFFELLDVAQHGASTLRVETEEVTLVNHRAGLGSGLGELMAGRKIGGERSEAMEVLYTLLVTG